MGKSKICGKWESKICGKVKEKKIRRERCEE